MEKPTVYFTDLRTSPGNSLPKKLLKLVRRAGIGQIDFKDKFTAIKIHFGEPGNVAYIRHNYVAAIVDLLKEYGAKVFLTDSNTLYSGGRSNAVDHLKAAMDNGFNPISAHADVIIADGLKGTDYKEIELNGEYCKAPKIGAAIADADIVISMNHFKGHEQTGFGGALKNLGMGSASVGGKLELHSSSQPVINLENCIGCRICEKYCRHAAVTVTGGKAHIDYGKCVGCGQCVAVCQHEGAVVKDWDSSETLNYKIAEYALAVVKDKPSFHISFIMNVSPNCDCWNHNDAAIIPDLGIAASFDPVALDCACADLVKAAPVLQNNAITDIDSKSGKDHSHDRHAGEDKFHIVHPDTKWEAGVEHGEKIGLGSREYTLVRV
ncbi:MAG: DUF362 domain-containing protein [Bacteroidetes bacterium]|uniref:DUF362 domain-containing protein n=1 Tax=Candidatus Cryptobacteroides faecipullorum TaxID=2840764 RepID=A0A9D9I589_9BACT|nr:DUF362 domain-containing protein [Candidatus Cryptobacteroides faecipullorum]